jgi:SAM-dependent methyltransferase
MSYSPSYYREVHRLAIGPARRIVPILLDIANAKRVVDIGCGPGSWLSVFREHGAGVTIGVDQETIPASRLVIPQDCFRVVDLRAPFRMSETFDAALSFEVAEHLPATSADSFVESLCQLAPVVWFSAAVPGQGGLHHVNEQWPEYWRARFAGHGFSMFDAVRPFIWLDRSIPSWYRRNIFLFVRHDTVAEIPRLASLQEVRDGDDLLPTYRVIQEEPGQGRVTRGLRRLQKAIVAGVVDRTS